MRNFLRQLLMSCLLLCPHAAFASKDLKLIFALDLVRHGDRTPARYMPEVSNAWTKEEIGKLTPLGLKNSALLGTQLRKYYIEEEKMLPKEYSADLMYVRSTYVERAQDTAKYILHGFYPDGYAGIQIEVVPQNQDNLLRSHLQNPEEKQSIIKAANEKFLYDKGPIYENARLALKELNAVFGTKFDSWLDIAHFCDVSKVSKIHNKSLLRPITSDKLENICKAGVKIGWAHFESDSRMRCLYAKPFMLHIAEVIQSQSSGHAGAKYMLYVAHDANIISSSLLLGRPLNGTPPYLSDLRFEMFKNLKIGADFVRVSLNGEPIKVCADVICPAEEFISTVRAKVSNQCSHENTRN